MKEWSECTAQEKDEVRELEKRIRKLKKYISLGYLTEEGKKYFTSELEKDIKRTEKRYRDD